MQQHQSFLKKTFGHLNLFGNLKAAAQQQPMGQFFFSLFAAAQQWTTEKISYYEVSTNTNKRRWHHLFRMAQLSNPLQHRWGDS